MYDNVSFEKSGERLPLLTVNSFNLLLYSSSFWTITVKVYIRSFSCSDITLISTVFSPSFKFLLPDTTDVAYISSNSLSIVNSSTSYGTSILYDVVFLSKVGDYSPSWIYRLFK